MDVTEDRERWRSRRQPFRSMPDTGEAVYSVENECAQQSAEGCFHREAHGRDH
jgi:hypothetical protein